MNLIKIYKITRLFLLFSFFLPFVKFCSLNEYKGKEEGVPDTAIVADSTIPQDFLSPDTVFTSQYPYVDTQIVIDTENDQKYDRAENRSIQIFHKAVIALVSPDYSGGITGFGLVVLTLNRIQKDGLGTVEWTGYIMPLSFILSGIALFLPVIRKRMVLLIFNLIVAFCFLTALFLSLDDLTELLFGFWIAFTLAVFNAVAVFNIYRNRN